MNFVAPGMTDDQYDESKRLEVYRSRTTEWILAFAIRLSKEEDGGVSSLIVATSVIEPMGGILSGGTTTETRFKAGFEYVFPEGAMFSKDVYSRLRGGLMHEGFIKIGLALTDLDVPIAVRDGTVYVDPVRFAVAVNAKFQIFCDSIKNDPALNQKFSEYWSHQVETNVKPVLHNPYPTALSTTTLSPGGGAWSSAGPIYPGASKPTTDK